MRETRIWGSMFAPIYLQLLEGLRRVSEGKPGATWCRECGGPFLTLDARRSMTVSWRATSSTRRSRRSAGTTDSATLPWVVICVILLLIGYLGIARVITSRLRGPHRAHNGPFVRCPTVGDPA